MGITRRNFMKATGLGAAAIALGDIGCSSASAQGYSKQLKIKGAKEVITSCLTVRLYASISRMLKTVKS